MDKKREKALCAMIYMLAFALTSAPVFCGYVMEGGDAVMWLCRIREVRDSLAAGTPLWFPSPELATAHGGQSAAFDCGIWLLPAAGLQLLGAGEQLAYCLFMGMAGLGTMAAAYWMMRAFFEERAVVFCGVLFYMGSPQRIYICFDRADVGQALVWVLVPLLVGGLARGCQKRCRGAMCRCISVLAYAGIWYADARWGVIVGGCAAAYLLLWKRRPGGLLLLAAGGGLALPVAIYLARYLVKGGMQVWDLPLGSIMGGGYTVGLFMTSWAYRPDLPGLGMGLGGALLLLAWLHWGGEGVRMDRPVKGLLTSAGLLTLMSLKYFPWDYVQRLGAPFLRFVGLLETSGIFWGLASMLLAVPAAWAVGEARRKRGPLWRWVLPAVLVAATLATALYLCNSLTYVRLPLGRQPVSEVQY